MHYSELFIDACMRGNLQEAKCIFYKYKLNIHINNDEAFRYACNSGNINIAKWLYSLEDKPNIHANDDEVFRYACYTGNINIAQWLYELEDKPNIHALCDAAFRIACYYDNISIVNWLVTISNEYYVEIKNNQIIRWKIKNNIKYLI